ncbi:MAG: hypothetical protein KF784_03355 [Fimbriimonadaceae bacterium]|nr:hypothetical protein [Fimbriimonadaceae bacterium]
MSLRLGEKKAIVSTLHDREQEDQALRSPRLCEKQTNSDPAQPFAPLRTCENLIQNRKSKIQNPSWAAIAAILIFATTGCAKFPSNPSGDQTTRVTFTITMDQAINQNFVYIFALNPSDQVNPPSQGPIPVISPPWGNGFVAGNARYFIRWDPSQSPRFQIFRFEDTDLLNFIPIGTPVNFEDVQPGDRTFHFDIDMSQIADTIPIAEAYQTLQVNILTMDNVPQGNGGGKAWDALGNSTSPSGINDFLNVDLRTSRTYRPLDLITGEPVGDVADPRLDISDFRIEVRPR